MNGSELRRTAQRPGMKAAYGGVVIDQDSRVLLRAPKGQYGGYAWTFAKGGADPGEGPEEAALREVREETGVEAVVVTEVPGWFAGTTSDTKVFVMRPLVDHGDFQWETTEVRWVAFAEAATLIGETPSQMGRMRDLEILAAARAVYLDSSQ